MLIYNAEIHTMDSDEMIPNGWVEVREGKITDIGSGAPNLIPEDSFRDSLTHTPTSA